MKILRLSKVVCFIFGLMLLGACSDGEDGAVGPQGEQGEDGNANVKSYLFEDQSYSIGTGTIFEIPAITQSILDYGVVLVYTRAVGANFWYSLPIYNGNDFMVIHTIRLGELNLRCSYSGSAVDFRIVVIEGTDGSASKAMSVEQELKRAGVDVSDFYQVADYYGLDY